MTLSKLPLGRAKLALVRQTETSECGLACLTMIATYHGADLNLAGLRSRYGTSIRGVTLRSMIKIAGELGLASRAVRLDLDALPNLSLPAIAHWDLDHFVVLERVTRNGVIVYDPARGVREYSYSELTSRFTGVALELSPASEAPAARYRVDHLTLSDFARQLPNFWLAAGQVAALAALLQIMYLVLPLFLQSVIDKVLPGSDVGMLTVLAFVFAGVYALAVLCDGLYSWIGLQFGHEIGYSLISGMFGRLIRLPLEWFETRKTGDILTKIQSQRPIQETFISTLPSMVSDAIVVLTTAVVLTIYSPTLSAIIIVSLIAIALTNVLFYPRMKRFEEELLAASAEEQGYVIETLRAIRVIRMFGAEQEREAAWHNQFTRVINSGLNVGRSRIYLKGIQGLINSAQTICIVYVATLLVIEGISFTPGMLFAFLFFRQTFTDKSSALIQKLITLKLTSIHLARVSDILMSPTDDDFSKGSGPANDPVVGKVELRQVWMRYGADSRPVVRGVDLAIAAGEFVAIVGPTGGGKSSLLKLIAGLASPYSGEICVDGIAMPIFGRARWRAQVGSVMQDDTLISGTVADNISFFDPDVDHDRLAAAAKMAAVDQDIAQMPMRYWTWIGDMGGALSGGQRQRILLARALYGQPKLLLLDEGTANLDTDTENAIVETIAGMAMTRIVVTHRPALVERADRVITVINGVVTELRGASGDLAVAMASSTLKPSDFVNWQAQDPASP